MQKHGTRPKLVIFDCDGVLVDSETVSNQVLVANLARHGLNLDLHQAMDLFVGGTMKGVMQKARGMGADLPSSWVDDVYAETYARLEQGVDLVPGILDLLERLDAAEIPFCVASNGSMEKMQITLGQNNLWDRFYPQAMFSAHTIGIGKPEPDLFLAAARHFQTDARDCVVIEDSENGACAADRAGMRCLGFAPHGEGARLARHNAEIFQDMSQVADLLAL